MPPRLLRAPVPRLRMPPRSRGGRLTIDLRPAPRPPRGKSILGLGGRDGRAAQKVLDDYR